MRETYQDKQHTILIYKQQIILIDFLPSKLKMFQEQWYQKFKQEEEELQQLRETYHDRQYKIIIDSLANELKVSRETSDLTFGRQEESLKQMRDNLKEKSKRFSS